MMKFIRSIQHRIDSINYPFVFMCLTTARILSALYNPIDDCDEVYNFYEPLHKVLYDDQPSFQTWEYSPHYAMRSYAYLLLHALPLYLIPITYKIPFTIIDSYYYGKLVITPFNHIKYNIFSKHGPTLYGTEPWTYYLTNGILNFNIVYPLAFIGLLITNVMPRLTKKFRSVLKKQKFILLNDVQIQKTCLLLVIFIVHALLSLSRTIAIIRGYSGSMRLLRDVNTTVEFHQNLESPLNVCIGKDWYRFPSHFFLPERYQLQFIRSEFRGQLPKHYSRLSNATKIIHNDLNDENKEEISHYVDITNCQYIIDHDSPEETKLEPNYAYYPNMKQISATKMILSSKSHAIFRAFYVPFLTEMYTKQTYLHLLRNNQQDANE
ncbi:unnamed protein product [Didymodactylos carnosus]|uniref:Mannosyltransferase n=1 Tax=Didymodactylos carnosus TaxID=1234261 RepID=A0A813XWK0_9BILA|nr:unnamed protein product [Didymodactylos carnosus]CAF0872992.1 unnamed protein product [Didymodactylos carnosus]CAF3536170.1 unnamed protein product [Didymodactylos carnosus]CAF3660186.1 unnamed protein product [Didymodactylos carnosus]